MKCDLDLRAISDSELLVATKRLASEERRIGIEVLHYLREIDARKLFASLGFSSLFVYCTTELGYSEGGAYRRISAMRLLRDVPEYEVKLQEGAVSVATLSQVQSFLIKEKRQLRKAYTQEEKLDLLAKIEGKSSQQTERVLAGVSPLLVREERARAINENETEIRFTADRELMEKLDHLKNLLGHKSETQSYVGLFRELADIAVKKLDPMRQSSVKKGKENVAVPKVENAMSGRSAPGGFKSNEPKLEQLLSRVVELGSLALPLVEVSQDKTSVSTIRKEKRSRYISTKVRRDVWKRDRGRCAYTDSKTGRRCDSHHALEYEHVRPFSMGGENTWENLKLLCPAHNQYAAIQKYGLSKMQKFWKV